MDAKTTQRQHIRVRRYSGSARINHWIVATSFVLLAISGLSLFHPSLYPIGATLFGNGQTLRWIHPWLGVILVIGFFGLFIRFLPANLPETTDFVWLSRIGRCSPPKTSICLKLENITRARNSCIGRKLCSSRSCL